MFAENLKKAMEEKGINSATLVRLTGFSKGAVSQYVNGIITPSQQRREAIAAILGVDAQELEGMKDPDPYNPDPYAAVLSGKATLTCQEAAALLHKRPDYIRLGLQQGRPGVEFGSAVKVSGKWSYCIYANKFAEVTGIPVTAISGRDRG